MPFVDNQIRKLQRLVSVGRIKERQVDGKVLHYVEGWYVIAEANRIFGFDGWDRETVSSQCVSQKQSGHRFCVSYLTRVRISVRAGATVITREGLGSGEAVSATAGQAHERASKAAETDATKRALCTFGNPFGLSLYDKTERSRMKGRAGRASDEEPNPTEPGFVRRGVDRPGFAEGPEASTSEAPNGNTRSGPDEETAHLPRVGAATLRIDKSTLTLNEPRRLRDKEHLRFVASHPCLVCGRSPSHAHHVRLAQPRALGRKVSDEFTVPLCPGHHHELHARGDENAWWHDKGLDPLPVARRLWQSDHDETRTEVAAHDHAQDDREVPHGRRRRGRQPHRTQREPEVREIRSEQFGLRAATGNGIAK